MLEGLNISGLQVDLDVSAFKSMQPLDEPTQIPINPQSLSNLSKPKKTKTKNVQTDINNINQLLADRKKIEENEKKIMQMVAKYDIKYDQLDLILKFDAAEIINLDMFSKLRDILNKPNTKSKVMEEFSIMKTYIGFYNFTKGLRLDLPATGLNAIANTLGYSLAIVPIKNSNDDLVSQEEQLKVNVLQNKFLEDVEQRLAHLIESDKVKFEAKMEEKKPPENSVVMEYIQNSNSSQQIDLILDQAINPQGIGLHDVYVPKSEIKEKIEEVGDVGDVGNKDDTEVSEELNNIVFDKEDDLDEDFELEEEKDLLIGDDHLSTQELIDIGASHIGNIINPPIMQEEIKEDSPILLEDFDDNFTEFKTVEDYEQKIGDSN